MKRQHKILTALVLAAGLLSVRAAAQQDPMVSQYMFSGHFLNPAYAGSHEYANITVLGRRQWIGFDGAPLTSYVSFDAPLAKKNIGYGVLLANDMIGVTNRSELAGTFSYHLKLSENAKLAFGLRAGITYYRAKLSDLVYWDQQDAVFQNDISGKVLPNSGAGIYFYTKRFYAGAAIPNVINYKPETALAINLSNSPHLERHYFATTGYVIPAGKNLDIKPAVVVKYVPNSPLQVDGNLNFFFYKTLWVGGSYRSAEGVQGMIEYQATKNLRVGYAYDMALTSLRSYNSGSHEIMIAWDFVKEEQIRYKSPRFF